MKSQNSYSGINPIVVKYVKYYVKYLKRLKCFADESIEDIEQELFLLVWSTIIQYDESKSCFVAFVKQLVKCRAINLVYRQSCEKRGGKQGILYIDHTILDNIADERCRFEDEIADRSDLDYIVSTLPQEWQVLCRQLEIFSVPEVAEIRGIARTTVYDILRRIRRHTKKSFLEPPTTENHSGI
ncbi:MAG: sigma-70 family RNA polymerase sigma factor [Wolbachia endosymbiont of Andrena nigroaenea]|uniref:sigma-70 family RNA polymerase sigma factor n=1 Tax=Wolbachia endosymbiont (group A) of Andrena hattorfiana TaxID=2953977 RepID=UPI0021F908F3|nr:sigma-70 family RNA polymerase sigma factor [Wolbachia endosymbiont (group A) of Andrena hattorfiana]MDX5526273.1 sigma-70 family RNA polymerase sigma factor [Wolbachia endosymbiont of Andrena nigroaenea]